MSANKINFHTHTTFCDGKNTAEEMVLSAIEKGFTHLGFSSHCLHPLTTDFYKTPDDEWHIRGNVHEYTKEIKRLKEKYQDKITIYTGFEADYFEDSVIGSAIPDLNAYCEFTPDFLIGSVHFVNTPKGFYTVDHTVENIRENLNKLYGKEDGSIDGKKAVCEYFEAERQMLKKGNFNILGHADLIRKRNGILQFFNETESWYKEQLKLTAEEISRAGVVVEINTGAIARKVMDDVYPSAYMLNLLYEKRVPVCVNSDSHNVDTLDCAFERAYKIARSAGYKELVYPLADKEIIVTL